MSDRSAQRGFTLIEMMVALILFSFAIVGLFAVASSMSSNVKEQRQVVQTETDVRAPMDFLSDALRMASPAIASGNIEDATATTCFTVDTANSFAGLGALAVKDSTTGPDQMDVVFASGGAMTTLQTAILTGSPGVVTVTNDAGQVSQFANGDKVLVTNTNQGTIFNVTAATGNTLTLTAGCAWTPPVGGYPTGAMVIRVVRARFSIGLVDSIPTLMMNPDPSNAGSAQPLAEGIEDMQIAVGLDTDANYTLDTWNFVTGTTATPGVPRAIRITLTARSNAKLSGTGTVSTPKAIEDRPVGVGDMYRRRFLTSTIELRNFGGSP